MANQSGAMLFAMLLGVLLAAAVAWGVAGAYRRHMLALMRKGAPPDAAHAMFTERGTLPARHPPARLDLAANRRAALRFLLLLSTLSLLIGVSQSWLALLFVYDRGGAFSLNRLLVLGAVYAWPMVMGWGLVLRWSWARVVAGIAAYMLAMSVLVMLTSNAAQTIAGVGAWLAGVVAIPMLVTLAIAASGRIRAVAPYLLPFFLLLSGASVAAVQALAIGVESAPAWLTGMVEIVGAWGTLLTFVLAPWLLLAWPVYALGRWLARAYRGKRFSDLGYLFAAYWFVILAASALPALQTVGLVGLTQLLPWLWLPIAWRVLPRWLAQAAPPSPPTLLVLRVFQRDAQVERLFDRIVERWRLSGNTLLIAGTDLISRTLDPDDLFAFLNGQLAGRFIASEAEIPVRLAGLDLQPDPDGRYRVNECYCFDSTWQPALRALVQASDVVLMDLRGFTPENQGCRFELRVLAAASHLRRVLLLHDGQTAGAAAAAEFAAAPADRFVWLEAGRLNSRKTGEVLAALFGAAPPPLSHHSAPAR
ncbi:MAG TPA: hypothetical protein PLS93_03200 [Accumulibacter sp.]|jgi:hypothetical protein|nr:hypothetical protein [Accumulibacter sp.]